ncbi:hypothetical protein N7468_007839 [Penicillium chermesinum]|uniref:Uncharacterized protein n=1 Tax=Penicillium chermesinum TaxID=63820 RepID=A0A9W9NNL7_9EURO|nr:uncharacterized protein N7468_007839 [Penicillium chermesinum]KAJ5223297.1 hypothetical protein N7468_007839 [Penicillium chermesinum]KAJ6155863.1 hypothetical protein N7470_006429 [Penicillium chermesinum]
MVLLMPELIQVNGPEEQQRKKDVFTPTCHIFYEQRIMDIADGLPKWSGMDNSSTLLDDGGQESHSK